MRSWITIALWVLGILFPLGWLGSIYPASEDLIDWLMEPEWLHIVMHIIIFAGLVILVLAKQRRDGKAVSFLGLVLIILAVGGLQELFQYLTQDYWVPPLRALRRSAFDLMVDLAGGMIGMGIFLNLLDRGGPHNPNPPLDPRHG